ncbi:MAG: C1 family peptidase [Flavobacteriales bacterium]
MTGRRQASCTAWALGYGLMTYRMNRVSGRQYGPKDTLDPKHAFSPAYLYNLLRMVDGQDCLYGADLDKLFALVMFSGCCDLETMPYDTALGSCKTMLPTTVMREATANQVPPAISMAPFNATQWKYHLSEGRPIVAYMAMCDSVVHRGFNRTDTSAYIWDDLLHTGGCFGHTVLCTGYTAEGNFIFRNSFGKDWGKNGDFQMTHTVAEYKISTGYILTSDTAHTRVTGRGKRMDKDTLTGPLIKERIAPGRFQVMNDKRITLARYSEKQGEALIHVHDIDSDTLQQTMVVRPGQSYVFYEEGQALKVRYELRSKLRRWIDRSVPLVWETRTALDDPYLRLRNKSLEQFRKALGR